MATLVTQESVFAAAEAIRDRGERPTVTRVRAELGGGSPNDVLPLLTAWKDAQRDAPVQAPEPVAEDPAPSRELAALSDLPEVAATMDDLTRKILSTVSGFVQREREAATSAQSAIQAAADQQVRLAREAADAQLQDFQKEAAARLDEAREESQELAEALEQAEGVIATKDAEIQKLNQQLAQLDQRLGQAQNATMEANRRADASEAKAKATAEKLATAEKAHAAEIHRLGVMVEDARAQAAEQVEAAERRALDAEERAEKAIKEAQERAQAAETAVSKIRDEAAAATAAAEQRATKAEERADRAETRAEAAEKKAAESHERVLALLERLQPEKETVEDGSGKKGGK